MDCPPRHRCQSRRDEARDGKLPGWQRFPRYGTPAGWVIHLPLIRLQIAVQSSGLSGI